MAMAEEDLVTIVDVEDPDDPSFRYVKTMKRPLTDEELTKVKPILKNVGAYKFFKTDLGFSDGPAVKQFLDTVELDEFRRTDHFKIVQDDMKGIVAGKQVVINANLIRKTFGLEDDGANISKPNKKATDLHRFYIKPVHLANCQTKRGINLRHFKSEYSYIGNMARQLQFYCCGLKDDGFINFTLYRAVDLMIRKRPVNWNRYLMQNFQERFRKFRQKPCDLYFGGTLTALIYAALGVKSYSLLVPGRALPASSGAEATPRVEDDSRALVLKQNGDMIELEHGGRRVRASTAEKRKASRALQASNEAEATPTVGHQQNGDMMELEYGGRRVRASTAEKRKASLSAFNFAKKKLRAERASANGNQGGKPIVKRTLRKKRLQPPRRVTMGKLELITQFSHRGPDLSEDMTSKLTKMYYQATGMKPRRSADVSYPGSISLSSQELWKKYEDYCALEEELLLEHAIAKRALEESLEKVKHLEKAISAKDEELSKKVDMFQGLDDALKMKSSELVELEAELSALSGSGGLGCRV